MSKVRVRIAPSPTGLFHLGSLRTALTNYLFARKNNGVFVVRVEDTDQARLVPAAIPDMLKSLEWAGMKVDEGVVGVAEDVSEATEYEEIKKSVVQKGDFGPYLQSERLDIYRKYADELIEKGLAYPCFCSAERLDALRKEQTEKKMAPKYDRHCLSLDLEEAKERMKNEPYVLRFKIPEGRSEFVDSVRGKISFENKNLDDFVLMKSDGFPTYHFAVVVDDYLMEISHVFRGEEWIPSTPKHILLYQAFGWEAPVFGHLTTILNTVGGKLSKRDGDVSVSDFRKKGYLPEAIVNFIALLGWNPKTEQEIFSLKELEEIFDDAKLNKAAPRFDRRRLDWFSSQYIKNKSDEELLSMLKPFFDSKIEEGVISRIIAVFKDRAFCLSDFAVEADFVMALPDYDSKLLFWKDISGEDLIKSLNESLEAIGGIVESEYSLKKLEELLIAQAGDNRGRLLWPLRVALSGKEKSPSPFECAWLLGHEESLRRINLAIKKLEK